MTKVYELTPLAPLTEEIGSGCWPTPRSQEPGATTVGYGRGLAELIEGKQQRWPTPRNCSAMTANFTQNTAKAKFPNLETVVARIESWPTTSSNNGTGGATGLAGGSGNRKKLYTLLGKEEGKKMGCQSLNPYWVEWLMGYPIGFTDLGDSAMPLSRKLPKR